MSHGQATSRRNPTCMCDRCADRRHYLDVPLSPEEKTAIVAAAKRVKMPVLDWCRTMLLAAARGKSC